MHPNELVYRILFLQSLNEFPQFRIDPLTQPIRRTIIAVKLISNNHLELDHLLKIRDSLDIKTKKNKHVEERKALIKAVIFFLILVGGCALVLLWASRSQDSEVAEKIRKTVGIKAPAPVSPEAEPSVSVASKSMSNTKPTAPSEPIPIPIPTITFLEITRSPHLWPKTVALTKSKQVSIRYQDNNYGYMEFTKDSDIEVIALKAPSDVYCSINGNFLSLSVNETKFAEWFTEKYADRYVLEAIAPDALNANEATTDLSTPEGEKTYLNQMRLWCHKNYESISLEIGEDALIFKWLPKEDAPIDYQLEAREIARKYLLLRAELGGTENYAACEIRDPVTNELLGAGSVFIPRL